MRLLWFALCQLGARFARVRGPRRSAPELARGFFLALALALAASPAAAQAPSTSSPAPAPAPAPPASAPAPAPAPSAEPAPKPAPRGGFDDGASIDLSTPRQCVAGFLRAAEAGQLTRAVRYLDLRGLRWDEQTPLEAAGDLAQVLERRVWLDVAGVSDRPEGMPEDGGDLERIAVVKVDGEEVPITLARVRRGDATVWLFSATTVARIPDLTRALGTSGWVLALVPKSLEKSRWGGLWAWQWAGLGLAIVAGFPLGHFAARLILSGLVSLTRRTRPSWDGAILERTRSTLRFALGWLCMGLVAMSLDLPPAFQARVQWIISTPLIFATGYFLRQAIHAVTADYLANVKDEEEVHTRGLRTQIVILRKLSSGAIAVITFAIALMQFEVVRSVGWSLLASAGVAGVVLGFAAQKSLGAIIAGLQLSMTQPVRLGDAIVLRGEAGVIEEIALTYVRVKLADERRLIVPIEKFLTETFENLSQPGNELVGIVDLPVDPSAPIATLRAEIERYAAAHPTHDGRECAVQVVELDAHRAVVRARISSGSISRVYDMRCDIREHMMRFLQDLDQGRYLPRQRFQKM
jgi:small-conductance mechanosensitive channel